MPSLPMPIDGSGSENEEDEQPIDGGSGSENEEDEQPIDGSGSENEEEHAAEDEHEAEEDDEESGSEHGGYQPIAEFNAGNEFLNPEPPMADTLDALGFRSWNALFISSENKYMNWIDFEAFGGGFDLFGDDDDNIGYTNEIKRNLSRIAHYLSVRRKLRLFKFVAHKFRVDVPDIIEEFKICTEILAENSVEVNTLLENPIQIRNPPELDVALFLIDGNGDPDNLPIFYLPERVFEILNREGKGRFRSIIRDVFEWGTDIVLGGAAPAAVAPPPAAAVQPPPAAAVQPPPAAAVQPPPANGHLAANGNGHPAVNGHP